MTTGPGCEVELSEGAVLASGMSSVRQLRWHIVTPEYPPQIGGVGDYTAELVQELRRAGDHAEVWCPASSCEPASSGELAEGVHHSLGRMSLRALLRLRHQLNRSQGPRIVLVQWVPHGYGYRSMNVAFCLWVLIQSFRDNVQLMVHEPFLAFGEGTWRQDAAALVHRGMMVLLLRASSRVWVSTPSWAGKLRRCLLGRDVPVEWLPVTSNIPVSKDLSEIASVRRSLAPSGELLLGHFGTFNPLVTRILDAIIAELSLLQTPLRFVLAGAGSREYRERLCAHHPQLTSRLTATGRLPASGISHTIQACDVLLQPFPDGVSARRGSAMAALSHGVPLVTNAGKATETCWSESGAVRLLSTTNPAAFRTCVEELARNTNLRVELARAGREFYRERFHISVIADRLRAATAMRTGQ